MEICLSVAICMNLSDLTYSYIKKKEKTKISKGVCILEGGHRIQTSNLGSVWWFNYHILCFFKSMQHNGVDDFLVLKDIKYL